MKDYWQETTEKKINKKKILILILISILVIGIIVIVSLYITNKDAREWIDTKIFRKQVTQNNVSVIELDAGQTSNIYAFNKYIGILNKNKLNIYGNNGNKETEIDLQINNPIFNSANRFLAIAETKGQKVYLIEDKQVIWENSIEGNISQIHVNESGYVAVIISDTSYKSIIEVFDPKGNELFKRFLSTTMAVDVSISNDNKHLAIAEVNPSGTVIQSNIRIISIEKAKTDPANSEEKNYTSEANRLVTNVNYQNKNKLICMYTDGITMIENDAETTLFENKDKKITLESIELNNNVVTVEEKSSGIFSADSVVNIVNIENKSTKEYTVNTVIKEFHTEGDIIALNLGTEIEFINTGGWLVKRYIANQEITNITVGNNIAGIIYRDKVEIVNL